MSDITESVRFMFTFLQPDINYIHEPNYNPTFAHLNKIQTQLNVSSVLIHSDSGDVRLRHYLLVETADEDRSMSNQGVDFSVPTNPGAFPTVPVSATGPYISEIHWVQKIRLSQFCTW